MFVDQFASFESQEVPLILTSPAKGNSMPKELQNAIGTGFNQLSIEMGESRSHDEWFEKFESLNIPVSAQNSDSAIIVDNVRSKGIEGVVGLFVKPEHIEIYRSKGGMVHSQGLESLLQGTRWPSDEKSLYHEFSSSKAADVMACLSDANIPFESTKRGAGFFGQIYTVRIETEEAAYGISCHGAKFKNGDVLADKYSKVRFDGQRQSERSVA